MEEIEHQNTESLSHESKIQESKMSLNLSLDEAKEIIQKEDDLVVNPYYEADPTIGGEEYKEGKFLSRGFHSKPNSYQPVCQRELHSCAKMDACNWMKKIKKPFNEDVYDIVEVRFKNNRKDFFRLPEGLAVVEGDVVAVEGNPGHDVGIVSMTGELCRIQMRKRNVSTDNVKKLYRRAKVADIEKWMQVLEREDDVLLKTKIHIQSKNMTMKLNDVEFQGDGSKAIFYYTAEDRVDFRDLIKILAEEFKVRIEMKQIGVRQESGRIGGIGTCGRELCCCTWLTNFQSVNTSAAKAQQIVLNPQKLAGQCGKLKCCLNYEYEMYQDAISKFPDNRIQLNTKKGVCIYHKTDVFRELMWYSYENDYDIYALSVSSVKEIIAMNKNGELPERLEDYKVDLMSKSNLSQEVSENEFERNLSLLADVEEGARTVQQKSQTRREDSSGSGTSVQRGKKGGHQSAHRTSPQSNAKGKDLPQLQRRQERNQLSQKQMNHNSKPKGQSN